MTSTSSRSIVWQGKPWITPAVAARGVLSLLVAIAVIWIESFTGTENNVFLGIPLFLWTAIVFFVIWLISLTGLLIERATNTYTLRSDSLEIRTGIATSRSLLVVPSGFSDLEVVRGVIGRIIEYGDIIIRTQSERDSVRTMIKVKDPLKVSQQIRYVMGRPIVRVEQPPSSGATPPP